MNYMTLYQFREVGRSRVINRGNGKAADLKGRVKLEDEVVGFCHKHSELVRLILT